MLKIKLYNPNQGRRKGALSSLDIEQQLVRYVCHRRTLVCDHNLGQMQSKALLDRDGVAHMLSVPDI